MLRLRYTVDSNVVQEDVFLLILLWMQQYVHRYIKSVEKSKIIANFRAVQLIALKQKINRD